MNKVSIDTQFSGFIAARNNETATRWKKVQIFFIINSALIGLVMTKNIDGIAKIFLSIIGCSVTTIWCMVQIEAQLAIDYWNNKIADLEKTKDSTVSGFKFEHHNEGFCYKYTSTHHLVLYLIVLFIMSWIYILFSNIT